MLTYFIKTPWWVRKLFSSYVWRMPATGKVVYLTFDDGPHETITPWVLDELKRHGAKVTFFCIGNNVAKHPHIYARIMNEGHAAGNHTWQHLNGWKASTGDYMNDVTRAARLISTNLFRPPYGKIKGTQARGLAAATNRKDIKVVMWDVLSADFDNRISAAQCISHVLQHVEPGSVVVFHDSAKAEKNLRGALPAVLITLANKGYRFEKIVI